MSYSFESIPLELLRTRAFNSRWAQQPEGVIPLTAADPDFVVCPAIQEALIRYTREGVFSYAPPEGLPIFRDTVAQWFTQTRNLSCQANEVFATDNAAHAMAVVAKASLRAGDEVLIPDPVDFLFRHCIERAGARAIGVPMNAQTDAPSFIQALQQRLTRRTTMLWLCNPHNPLGVVHGSDWLLQVSQWAVTNGLRILSDEIWSDMVYAPHQHTCVASLSPEIARKTVTVYGFSKNFALAGLRVGCVVCLDHDWLSQIVAASDAHSTVFGVSVLSQVAVVAALQQGRAWLADFVAHLKTQRDYVQQRLQSWPGVVTELPQGTYVAFPNVAALSQDVEVFCEHLRRCARVALVPGSARWFGPNAAGHLRICFATSASVLEEAFDRLDPVVRAWDVQKKNLRPLADALELGRTQPCC